MLHTHRCLLAVLSLVLAWTPGASADGGYGRLKGDMAVQLDVGGASSREGTAATGALTVRYLQTAGAYSTWIVHPRDENHTRWTASVGIEIRPLFLPRFLKNMQRGPPVADLAVDSLSLRLGAVTAPDGPFHGATPGWELALGFGVPLTSCASGPWLTTSGAVRVSDAAMAGAFDDRSHMWLWTWTVGWQTVFRLGLVDLGDTRP